jgi:mannose-6-phosphate isomerase-like protein (cupin superfamily)
MTGQGVASLPRSPAIYRTVQDIAVPAIRQEELIVADPIIATADERIAADGVSFCMHEWRGSGPPQMHVHHSDDEGWHVLAGTLRFRFWDQIVEVRAGSTIFVPAGVPHTYEAVGDARYLIILTPRLRALIEELQRTPPDRHPAVYARHESAVFD